jgi:neutral amino acid transport system ATP-binding protein
LIGPNGAGKPTLFNLLSNFIRLDQEEIIFDDSSIHPLSSYKIALEGCVRTFPLLRILSQLTVLENMLLTTQKQTKENLIQVWLQQK